MLTVYQGTCREILVQPTHHSRPSHSYTCCSQEPCAVRLPSTFWSHLDLVRRHLRGCQWGRHYRHRAESSSDGDDYFPLDHNSQRTLGGMERSPICPDLRDTKELRQCRDRAKVARSESRHCAGCDSHVPRSRQYHHLWFFYARSQTRGGHTGRLDQSPACKTGYYAVDRAGVDSVSCDTIAFVRT